MVFTCDPAHTCSFDVRCIIPSLRAAVLYDLRRQEGPVPSTRVVPICDVTYITLQHSAACCSAVSPVPHRRALPLPAIFYAVRIRHFVFFYGSRGIAGLPVTIRTQQCTYTAPRVSLRKHVLYSVPEPTSTDCICAVITVHLRAFFCASHPKLTLPSLILAWSGGWSACAATGHELIRRCLVMMRSPLCSVFIAVRKLRTTQLQPLYTLHSLYYGLTLLVRFWGFRTDYATTPTPSGVRF